MRPLRAFQSTSARVSRVAALTAAVLMSPGAPAVNLLPTVPLVQSYVTAQTYRSGNVTLADPYTQLYVYETNDYRYESSDIRSVGAYLGGGFQDTSTLNQWSGGPTAMSAFASTDFGVNRVSVHMDGNVAPDYHRAFGSLPPNAGYTNDYIGNFNYSAYDYLYDVNNERYIYAQSSVNHSAGFATPSAAFRSTYIGNFDYGNYNYVADFNNSRSIYVNSAFGYTYDPITNDLIFNDPGVIESDPGGSYFFVPNAPTIVFDDPGVVAPSPYGGSDYFFVPNMPEVEVDLVAQRSVQAYSRWEDVFYFGNGPAGNAGIATLTLQIDGSLMSPGYSGSFSFYARDWEHKDDYSALLASLYLNADPGGDALNQLLTIQIPFTYGEPQYVKAEAWTSLYGEGDVDFDNTIRLLSIEVPEESAVYSYATYLFGGTPGYNVLGGVDGGSLPGGLGGFFGGGGGGEVPVPAPVLLLSSALAVLWSGRVRSSA